MKNIKLSVRIATVNPDLRKSYQRYAELTREKRFAEYIILDLIKISGSILTRKIGGIDSDQWKIFDGPWSEAMKKAIKIRSRMKETVYLASAGHAVRMSASLGLATFSEDASDLTSFLALADKAMFRIKESGKDAIGLTGGYVFSSSPKPPVINHKSPHHIKPCGYQIYPVISLPNLLRQRRFCSLIFGS